MITVSSLFTGAGGTLYKRLHERVGNRLRRLSEPFLEAAKTLFAELGLEATTMTAIAERVRRLAFYAAISRQMPFKGEKPILVERLTDSLAVGRESRARFVAND
jgi:Bacterial regulatory proteins, tetR family